MDTIADIISYWPFLIILTVIVFVHELGHYLVARMNNVRVEVFSVGFGREIFGINDSHGTRWKFSMLPLGGYVKFYGDANVASAPGEPKVEMTDEEKSVSFHHKRVGQRMAVVLAGPMANFILAVIVFAFLFAFIGQRYTPAEISAVLEGSPAEQGGLVAGDKVVSIDGVAIERFEDLQLRVRESPGVPLQLVVEREQALVPLTVTPQLKQDVDRFGNELQIGLLGVSHEGVTYKQHGPLSSIWAAVKETVYISGATLGAVGQMIAGTRSTDELGGPVRIAQMSREAARDGFITMVFFMAVLSINLGLINLFPIPMLDGGHLVFQIYEAIFRKPATPRVMEIGFRVGFVLVIALMVWVTSKDLMKIF